MVSLLVHSNLQMSYYVLCESETLLGNALSKIFFFLLGLRGSAEKIATFLQRNCLKNSVNASKTFFAKLDIFSPPNLSFGDEERSRKERILCFIKRLLGFFFWPYKKSPFSMLHYYK